MTATARTEIVGAKEAIKALRKIDPELRKQFNRDAKEITRPVIDAAKKAYPTIEGVPSGLKRNWAQRGATKFPYSQQAAARGLRFKVDTSKKSASVIKIQQVNPAAVIIEVAGKRNANPLGAALDRTVGQPSRILWPAMEAQLPQVTSEMEKAVLDAVSRVNKELR